LWLRPTQLYLWQKQLFENGAKAFEQPVKSNRIGAWEARAATLEATLVRRNAALAEILDRWLNGCSCTMEHRERLAGSRGRK